LSAALASGSYLKPEVSKEGEAQNPLEMPGMDNAMDGMKKQAVMM
jgi:hypothetical protein